ncbi:hypothetical protein ACFE04_022248 [Oxalis oulophora]
MDDWKRSGQIPRFGDWDNAIDMPITQYFESARQAGLVNRYSNSSGEADHPNYTRHHHQQQRHSRNLAHQPKKNVKEQRKQLGSKQQGKVFDVTEQPKKQQHYSQQQPQQQEEDDDNYVPRHVKNPKPVDEDLYKIPTELLHSSKRKKKIPGLFSCLVNPCAS